MYVRVRLSPSAGSCVTFGLLTSTVAGNLAQLGFVLSQSVVTRQTDYEVCKNGKAQTLFYSK